MSRALKVTLTGAVLAWIATAALVGWFAYQALTRGVC